MATQTVWLKLLIDTKRSRVLFAEGGKDAVDFLFYLLCLPIGTVVGLLTKKGMVGCIGNLYKSVQNISDTYMLPGKGKNALLQPTLPAHGSNIPVLLPNTNSSSTAPIKFYRCSCYSSSSCCFYIANDLSALCPSCKSPMNLVMTFVDPPAKSVSSSSSVSNEGGFVKGVVTYMIMDDLTVTPMSTISSITLLNKFNIKEVGSLEEKAINLGIDEALELLKASLQSKTPLTDVFLEKKTKIIS